MKSLKFKTSYQILVVTCTQLNTRIDIRYAFKEALSIAFYFSEYWIASNSFFLSFVIFQTNAKKILEMCLQKKISRKLESRGRNFYLILLGVRQLFLNYSLIWLSCTFVIKGSIETKEGIMQDREIKPSSAADATLELLGNYKSVKEKWSLLYWFKHKDGGSCVHGCEVTLWFFNYTSSIYW